MALTDDDLIAISRLLDDKLKPVEEEIKVASEEIKVVKRQLMRSTAELKGMDTLILDEVERVHEILDKHKDDKTVHTI